MLTTYCTARSRQAYFPQVEEAIWREFPGPIDLRFGSTGEISGFQPRPWQYGYKAAAGTVDVSSTPGARACETAQRWSEGDVPIERVLQTPTLDEMIDQVATGPNAHFAGRSESLHLSVASPSLLLSTDNKSQQLHRL